VIHHGISPRDLLSSGVLAREVATVYGKKHRHFWVWRSFSLWLKVSSSVACSVHRCKGKILASGDNLWIELLFACFRSCILQVHISYLNSFSETVQIFPPNCKSTTEKDCLLKLLTSENLNTNLEVCSHEKLQNSGTWYFSKIEMSFSAITFRFSVLRFRLVLDRCFGFRVYCGLRIYRFLAAGFRWFS